MNSCSSLPKSFILLFITSVEFDINIVDAVVQDIKEEGVKL